MKTVTETHKKERDGETVEGQGRGEGEKGEKGVKLKAELE